MKSMFDFRFNIYIIGLTVSSIMERTVTYIINNYTILKLDPNGLGYHALSLVILMVFFLLSNVILKDIVCMDFVNKWAWKKQYVSGHWVEIIINDKYEVSHITNMEIECDISEITIHGTCCENTGTAYYFNSVCSKFDSDKKTVHYAFEQQGIGRHMESGPYYGYLHFENTSNEKYYEKYTGRFYNGKEYLTVYAIKIDKRNKILFKKINKLSSPENNLDSFIDIAINEVLPMIRRIFGLSKLSVPESFLSPKGKALQLQQEIITR